MEFTINVPAFIIGFFVGVALALMPLFWLRFYGYRSRKPIHREVDETEKYKAQRMREGFEQLMSYDVSKATGKKVT